VVEALFEMPPAVIVLGVFLIVLGLVIGTAFGAHKLLFGPFAAPDATSEVASASLRKESGEPSAKAREKWGAMHIPSADFDRSKWNVMLKDDPELATVADKLRPLGQKWVDEFAASYLAINDKSNLLAIVKKVISDARKEYEAQEAARQQH
jgi:hypothetical protein